MLAYGVGVNLSTNLGDWDIKELFLYKKTPYCIPFKSIELSNAPP